MSRHVCSQIELIGFIVLTSLALVPAAQSQTKTYAIAIDESGSEYTGGAGAAWVSKAGAWQIELGKTPSDCVRALILLPGGELYAAGSAESGGFVARINSQGERTAWRDLHGPARALAKDAAGEIYVGGDNFLAKLDSQLEPIYRINLSASAIGLAVRDDGTIYAAADSRLDTYSPDGQLLSELDLGSGTSITSVAIDPSGAVFLTGSTNALNLPAARNILNGPSDAFVGRVSPDGASLQWSVYLGGIGTDSGTTIAVRPDGSLVLAGSTTSPDFPGADSSKRWRGNEDGFLAQLDSQGNITESSYSGSGDVTTLALDTHGKLHLPSSHLAKTGLQPKILGSGPVVTSFLEGSGSGSDSSIILTSGSWSASTQTSWLHLGTASGNGNGLLTFNFDTNSGNSRTGTINVGGTTVTVTQAGANYTRAGWLTLFQGNNHVPNGLALDSTGANLYIADDSYRGIWKWNVASQQLSTVTGDLVHPALAGVAVDPSGNVFFSDFYFNLIFEWSPPSGPNNTLVSSGLNSPEQVALDASGNLYIADVGNHAVKKLSGGQVTTLFTDNSNPPFGVAVDLLGNVYYSGQPGVKRWTSPGPATTLYSGQGPGQMAVDGTGNVYVADTSNNVVRKWSVSSNQVTTLQTSGLNRPNAVAVDAANNIYVSDGNSDFVKVMLNVYVPTTGLVQIGAAGGTTALVGTLTPAQTLTGVFAPTSDQTWLHSSTISNGVVSFVADRNLGTARSATLTVLGVPMTVAQGGSTFQKTQGDSQTGLTGAAYPMNLQVKVTDQDGNGLAGVQIVFSIHGANGASGTFSGGATITTVSDGTATAPTLTANTTQGTFTVTAAVQNGTLPTLTFTLTNSNSPPLMATMMSLNEGNGTTAVTGQPFSNLQARVFDQFNRPLANAPVMFAFAQGTFAATPTQPISTDSNGYATAPVLTAGQTVGQFPATVSVVGTNVSLTITLNIVAPIFALATTSALEAPAAGSDSIEVVSNTSWTAASNSTWLHLTSGNTSGTGNKLVAFTFDQNTGATRSGTLTMPGITFTVTQAGSTYQPAGLTTLVSSGLNQPLGVAADNAGNLYIADTGNKLVEKWTAASGLTTLATPGVTLIKPNSAAVDAAGNVYIGEGGTALGRVYEFSPTGQQISRPALLFLGSIPLGVAVDTAGNVDFVDGGLTNVLAYQMTPNGVFNSLVYAPGFRPNSDAIAVDAIGNIYVADTNANLVGNQSMALVTTGLANPSGVAVDPAGSLYIADTGNNAIKKWTGGAQAATLVPASAGLMGPTSIAVDALGNVYIADTGNNALKELPHAYVPSDAVHVLGAGGSLALSLPVLPATQALTGAFAPTSNQSWIHDFTLTNGLLGFNVDANTGAARSAMITVLGVPINVNQDAGSPTLGVSVTDSGNGTFTQGDQGRTFIVTVSNTAGGATSNTTTVVLSLSDVTALAPTQITGSGWVCGPLAATITCTNSSGVNVGNSFPTITLTVNIAAGAVSPQSLTATVSGGGAASPVSGSDTVTILQTQTITFTQPSDHLLSDSPVTLAAAASSNLTVSFTSNSAAVCTVSGAQVTLLTQGTCSITASQNGNGAFVAASPVTRTFNVGKNSQTITFTQPADHTFGDASFSLTATASSNLTVTFISNSTNICTVSGSQVTIVAAGTCSIAADQAGSATFASAPTVTKTFNVSQKAQTITFTQPADHTFGDAAVTLVATSDSGLAVTLTSNSAAVCTVSGSQATIVGAGTCSIAADQAGNTNYQPAPTVTKAFNVAKKSQTITFTQPADHTFGDAAFGLMAVSDSGLTMTFTSNAQAVCTVSGSQVTIVAAGTCSISADQAGNGNYLVATTVTKTFNVNKKAQTITFTQPADHTFGDAAFGLTAVSDSGLTVAFTSNAQAVCTVSGSQVTILTAGACSISADQAGNGNYLAATTVTKTFNVNKKAQTITFTQPADHTFGDAAFGVTAVSDSGLSVTFTSTTQAVCAVSGSQVTIVAVGACSISADQAGNGNYLAATTVTKTFTVNKKAQDITFTQPADHTFGDAAFNLVATSGSGLAVTFTSNSTAVCTVSGPLLTIVAGGTCSISADQAGNGNYLAATTVTKTFNVAKKTQTITFTQPADHTFGDGAFNLVATSDSGLPVTFTSNSVAVCSVSGSQVTIVGGGGCSISADQAGNGNYVPATTVTKTFNVSKKTQNITFTQPADHTFGDAAFNLAATSDSGLSVMFTSNSTAVCVVSGSQVAIVGGGMCSISADQSGNGNYVPATTVTKTFNVAKKTETITFTQPSSHTFGDAPFSVTASSDSGLAVTLTSSTLSVCTVSGFTVTILSGGQCSLTASQAGNTNYQAASPVTQTFTVNRASETIVFAPLSSQPIGIPPFTIGATASSGLAVTFVSSTTNVCTVSGNTVTLIFQGACTITAQQAGNGNYLPATSVAQTFNVLGADMTIQISHPGHFSQGQTDASYTITAVNGGAGPSYGPVQVALTSPAGLSATAIGGMGWACVLATLTCSRSDVIAAGNNYPPITLTFSVSATAPLTVTNQAVVSGGGEINLSNDTATDSPAINQIVKVPAGQISVTNNGFGRNRTTGLWVATMTVTNTGTASIAAPLQIVFNNLTPGVTMTNNTGVRNGNPYLTVLPSGGLAPGASVSLTIQFANPINAFINFAPEADMGVF